MLKQGDVVSYLDMCREEGVNLQRGMNYRLKGRLSVILMSLRPGAPYADRIEENGKILIYEGHDIPSSKGGPEPKLVDQPELNPRGTFTQNGLFFKAALNYNQEKGEPELVKVYEKIKTGIWVYNGLFKLIDAWKEDSNARKVFKFKLKLLDEADFSSNDERKDIDHNRLIPTSVKLQVWKRDRKDV